MPRRILPGVALLNNVMVDLETLSTRPNAAILSIGAVAFRDGPGLAMLSEFKANVDPTTCQAAGLHVDAGTAMWWLRQAPEARAGLDTPRPVPLRQALEQLTAWIERAAGPTYVVWGNGATFDNVILRSAYEAAGLRCPWPYWADLCYRTVKDLAPQVLPPLRVGHAHDALDDARHQAQHLLNILRLRQEITA